MTFLSPNQRHQNSAFISRETKYIPSSWSPSPNKRTLHHVPKVTSRIKVELELLIGIWNAVVVNPAQGYLLQFRDKHKEQSINWGSTDSAPRLPIKYLLARLNPQPVHIVVVGTRRLNIYYCSVQNGQQNASVTLVIRLTWQMCSRTVRVWWNSSSLRDICPPPI